MGNPVVPNIFLNFDHISENSKITISLPNGSSVIAFLEQDVSYGGSAVYAGFQSNLLNNLASGDGASAKAMSSALDGAKKAFAGATDLVNAMGYLGANQPQMVAAGITTEFWQESPKFQISLPMTFVAFKEDMNVKDPVRMLVKSTYPGQAKGPLSAPLPGLLSAPNGYTGTGSNCCSLKIGKWFKIPKYLLIKSAVFSFSKETLENGNPLFAKGQVQFSAYKVFSADTIGDFLKRDNNGVGLADDYNGDEVKL